MSVTFNVTNTRLSLNVANGSAALILFDLLGFSRQEKELWGGELDPSDVLRRLSMHEVRMPNLVSEPSESQGTYIDENGVSPGCRVFESGYSQERVMRYVTTLEIFARHAEETGEEITYG